MRPRLSNFDGSHWQDYSLSWAQVCVNVDRPIMRITPALPACILSYAVDAVILLTSFVTLSQLSKPGIFQVSPKSASSSNSGAVGARFIAFYLPTGPDVL